MDGRHARQRPEVEAGGRRGVHETEDEQPPPRPPGLTPAGGRRGNREHDTGHHQLQERQTHAAVDLGQRLRGQHEADVGHRRERGQGHPCSAGRAHGRTGDEQEPGDGEGQCSQRRGRRPFAEHAGRGHRQQRRSEEHDEHDRSDGRPLESGDERQPVNGEQGAGEDEPAPMLVGPGQRRGPPDPQHDAQPDGAGPDPPGRHGRPRQVDGPHHQPHRSPRRAHHEEDQVGTGPGTRRGHRPNPSQALLATLRGFSTQPAPAP